MSVIQKANPASWLADLHTTASAGAMRSVDDGPVVAGADPTPRLRWALALLAASCLAVFTGFAVGMSWVRDDAPAVAHLASDVARVIAEAPPAAPAPVSVPVAQAVPPAAMLSITHRDAGWHIEAVGTTRLVVAQRLAQASGSILLGDLAVLASARPVHLDWQGRGAANAWAAVLGQEVGFATQCGSVGCRVWIIGSNRDEGGPALPPVSSIAPPVLPNVDVAVASSRLDSPSARAAAQHD